jgi:hypothetical protein
MKTDTEYLEELAKEIRFPESQTVEDYHYFRNRLLSILYERREEGKRANRIMTEVMQGQTDKFIKHLMEG